MVETEDLYTAADVKRVREQLIKEQLGRCALTGQPFPAKDYHTDHSHSDEQLVRGALYKQCNMALGKLENTWTRYLAHWYDGTLPDFLRKSADYIEKHDSKHREQRWRHNGWCRKVQTKFNQLNAASQNKVLEQLGGATQSNPVKRKDLFGKLVLDRKLGYNTIMQAIKSTKETNV